MPLSEKHRPKKYEQIVGQGEAISTIQSFLANFSLANKKAIVLHGPPGVGKTTIVHVAAKENNLEIFELNASDLRNKGKLHEILKPSLEQTSLTNKSKLILVDEVDGISAVDRGGLTELISLIKDSKYPIILTANDIWNRKFSGLRKITELVELKEINYMDIKNLLINILRVEGKFLDNGILTKISSRAQGDLRAAINDLQTALKVENPEEIDFDIRNKETSIFNALKLVFKGKPIPDTSKVFDSVNMNLDEIILWVEKNIPLEYSGEALARAMDLLSKTDVFRGRIYKQQYWRFMVYENLFLSYGISSAKGNKIPSTGFTSYKKPTRILKMWMNNQRIAKKKSITEKYAAKTHTNKKRALQEFPIIKNIIAKNPSIQSELRLEEDEVEYLMN